MNRSLFRTFSLLFLGIAVLSCGSNDESPEPEDNFDRTAMLANWADNIIIPAYQAYVRAINNLELANVEFSNSPSPATLTVLRDHWLQAYTSWQSVSMFEIGKAEELTLRNFTNIFPANAAEINENIATGTYNLELPSTNDEQGFPALDYMINGLTDSDAALIDIYTNGANAEAHKTYLSDLILRMKNLANTVLNDWTASFRDDFVNSSGSTATSSVNKLVNDFLFYYEKALRAGKVGIPAGVFSGSSLATHVEAVYKKDISKMLLLEALQSTQDFFNGRHFDGSGSGASMASYLNFLNTIKDGADLATLINAQFDAARTAINALNDDFVQQITDNNTTFLAAYDELQKNVVLLKVDMLQALDIRVDFVDADGD